MDIKKPVRSDHNRILYDADGELLTADMITALLTERDAYKAVVDAVEECENAAEVADIMEYAYFDGYLEASREKCYGKAQLIYRNKFFAALRAAGR